MSSLTKDMGDSSHDTIPSSPLRPSSPIALPNWLRKTRRHSVLLPSGKLRVLLVALCCIALGCLLTSFFDGKDVVYGDFHGHEDFVDLHSVPIVSRPGIMGTEMVENEEVHTASIGYEHEPSVSGALADLHDAVRGKLQLWNPYFVKPSHIAENNTASYALNATKEALLGEDIKDGISEDERLGARIRIGKCTILFNGNSFWERSIRTHERHDREHGYRLHVLRQHLLDDVWSKPAYILSLLLRELAKPESERLDWLFWVDADTIILNPHIPIEVFLPPQGTEFDDVHLIYSNDWNGLNNGVFPIRVNQWSAQLFSAITAYRHFRPEDPLQFRDQSAMDTLMHEPAFVDNIVQAPQRWFNAYQGEHNETLAPFQIRRGDFLVHFAGVPAREERMGYWLERAEQHLEDWEVPVKSTSYLQEVRDFWTEQKGYRQQKKETLAATRLRLKEIIERTNQQLSEFGDRLSEEQRTSLQGERDEANRVLEDGNASSDNEKLLDAVRKLKQAVQPLTRVITTVQKVLLNQAHEAIFGAEKDLLEGEYGNGARSPELERISETAKNLKNLVMTPQEHWSRQDIISATNAVTEARANLQNTNPIVASSTLVTTAITPIPPTPGELLKQVEAEANSEPWQAAYPTTAQDASTSFQESLSATSTTGGGAT